MPRWAVGQSARLLEEIDFFLPSSFKVAISCLYGSECWTISAKMKKQRYVVLRKDAADTMDRTCEKWRVFREKMETKGKHT